MRNIGKHRYKVQIESVSWTSDAHGQRIPNYTVEQEAWASIRFTRYGEAGTKKSDGQTQYNPERIEFKFTKIDIQYDWVIQYESERYAISALQRRFDSVVAVCATTPISDTYGP